MVASRVLSHNAQLRSLLASVYGDSIFHQEYIVKTKSSILREGTNNGVHYTQKRRNIDHRQNEQTKQTLQLAILRPVWN